MQYNWEIFKIFMFTPFMIISFGWIINLASKQRNEWGELIGGIGWMWLAVNITLWIIQGR